MSDQLAFDVPGLTSPRSAVISPCGQYRYRLDRRWGSGGNVAWVMLNPSTADGTAEDATSRRITAFSRSWGGYGSLTVVNLYAFRATKPADLWRAADPVGPEADRYLLEAVTAADLVVAAWGANAKPDRIAQVLELVGPGRLNALAVTDAGQPRHPLYLKSDLTPQPWEAP